MSATMLIDIVSVFPEYFDVVGLSLMGKARDKGLLSITTHNLRDWTHDVHHSVDDTPVGGGAGMVMKPEVWADCLDDLLNLTGPDDSDASPSAEDINGTTPSAASPSAAPSSSATSTAEARTTATPILIFPNPSAPLFTQSEATRLSHAGHLVFGCGRYEGYDARVPEYYRGRGLDVREYSIGDYVLNGGEVAVAVMMEAIVRLLPGFMGNPESIVEESYTGRDPLLEHRQYTRPALWRGLEVPPVLLSGDHGRVDRYRRDEALSRTSRIRPDLIERLTCADLDKKDRATLRDLGWDVSGDRPRR